jgi:threonine/homoserine/homoserine lactone efflux protein
MTDPVQFLSSPVISLALRAAMGVYVIYMARKFYADPTGYFRKSARTVVDLQRLEPIVRGLACFCLWGGCFIIATAIAVQVLGLHGDVPALALVMVAAIAAWLLLPKQRTEDTDDRSEV